MHRTALVSDVPLGRVRFKLQYKLSRSKGRGIRGNGNPTKSPRLIFQSFFSLYTRDDCDAEDWVPD